MASYTSADIHEKTHTDPSEAAASCHRRRFQADPQARFKKIALYVLKLLNRESVVQLKEYLYLYIQKGILNHSNIFF